MRINNLFCVGHPGVTEKAREKKKKSRRRTRRKKQGNKKGKRHDNLVFCFQVISLEPVAGDEKGSMQSIKNVPNLGSKESGGLV